MSTKRTPNKKQPVDNSKPKYHSGNKLFFVDNSGSKPRLLLGEVDEVTSKSVPVKNESKKIIGVNHVHTYSMITKRGEFEVSQSQLYPSFQLVANAFAKLFLEIDK